MDAIKKILQMLGGGAQAVGNVVVPQVTKGLQNTANSVGTFGQLMGSTDEEQKKKLQQQLMQQALQAANSSQSARTELGSFAIPFGEGANVASKFLLPGAVTGMAQASANGENPINGALSGAIGGGVIGGAGKVLGGASNLLKTAADDIGLRQFGLSAKDLGSLNKAFGKDTTQFIRDEGLVGKGIQGAKDNLSGLSEGYNEALNNPNFKTDPRDLVMNMIKRGNQLRENVSGSGKKLYGQYLDEAQNLIPEVMKDDTLMGSTMRKVKQDYGDFLKPSDFQANPDTARLNKQSFDVLKDTINTQADKLGIKVGDINVGDVGNKMKDYIDFIDLVNKRGNKDRATNLFGLSQGIGGALGGVYTAGSGSKDPLDYVKNVGVGAILPRILNNPKVLSATSGLLEKGGQTMAGEMSPILKNILGQVGARTGQGISSMLGDQNVNQPNNQNGNDNSNSNLQVSAATNNPNTIPQGAPQSSPQGGVDPSMQVTLSDGTKATYGQLQQQGHFQAAPAGDQPQSSDAYKQASDRIGTAMKNALAANDFKAFSQLLAMNNQVQDQMLQEQKAHAGVKKSLPAAAVQELSDINDSQTLLGDVSRAVTENKGKMGPIAGRISGANVLDPTAQTFDAQMRTAAQVVGKSLEGGKLSDQDIARYMKLLPNINDTPETAQGKIDKLNVRLKEKEKSRKNFYEQYNSVPQTSADTELLMRSLGQ